MEKLSPEWYAMIGAKGGKKKNANKGFGSNPRLAKEMGKLRKGKRNVKNQTM